jgi:hypothetical protein
VVLLRSGSSFIRDEAFKRVHLSLDILEQAAVQGPGIKQGIAIISSQLERATRRDHGVPRNNPRLDPSFAEYPQQQIKSTASAVTSQEQGESAPVSSGDFLDFLASQPPLRTTADPSLAAPITGPNQQNGLNWLDAPDLFAFLNTAPISTDDPFAFATDSSWNRWI